MFSIMTIASSTTKPTEIVNAIKRDVVEAVAEAVHDGERRQQRQRHRQARDHRRPQRAQKHEDHQDDENDRQHHRELDVVHRGADHQRAVGDQVDMHRRRHRLHQLRQCLLDRLDDLHRVGPGLALDRQALGRLAGEPGAGARVLHAVDDIGDIAEAHRRAVSPGDDDVAKTGGVEDLVVGVERNGAVRTRKLPFGRLTVAA